MLKLKRDGTFDNKEIDTRPRYAVNPLDIEQAERSARFDAARKAKIEQENLAEGERQKRLAAQWGKNRA